ncbi:ANTAR domain-containing protein [Prauserella muralis]|uniref:Uncharacterized protein n=1 Tax=Prauserella muralis TaxID=588067 RepID=A0A2V4B340_9PSEU|nr:ANTAR domain-containing protein [Prauserella muralis]PXY27565.1 hypothetical protein BAY60_14220 [Prauserella muralis]TWE22712.1 ANTAR domain-containing protein [Prauserella muralis]
MGDTTGHHRPDVAGDEDLREQIASLQEELNGLRRALRTRATIEQAMGVLVVVHQCSPQQAFRVLVRLSQQHNIKLHRIAQVLVRLAARVEPEQIEPLLRRAVSSGSVPLDGEPPEPDTEPDRAVLEHARALAESGEDDELDKRLTTLYELLVDRGWVPPYDVLASLRVRI